MKSIIFSFFFMASLVQGFAQNLAFDAKKERQFLLKNVGKVPSPGTAGPLFLSKNTAFPVLICSTGKRSTVVAAASMGKGKVVAFGHDGFFSEGAVANPQTATLLSNAVKWTAGTDKPVVLIRNSEHLANYLENQGFSVQKISNEESLSEEILDQVDVVALEPYFLNRENGDIELLKTFIQEGGGALLAGLGWGWQQLNPEKNLRKEHQGNILLADAGMAWVDGYADSDVFEAKIELPALLSYAEAKKYVLNNHFQKANKADYGMALNVLMDGIPMMNEKPFAISNDFPSNAPEGTPTVSKKVMIDTRTPYWHCTGLYAQAGAKISLVLQEKLKKSGFGIRIGTHTDELYTIDNLEKEGWKRHPEVSLLFDLQEGTTEVFNPFGGLIYIEVPENYEGVNLNLTISGAVEAPFFKLGQTSLAEWTAKIRNNPAPWGEIEGKELAFTFESKYLRNLDNPQAIAEFWDKIQAANKKLVDWNPNKSHKMRVAFDRQISAGYMHSGYPIMAFTGSEYVDEQANALNLKELDKWGFVHELGHNHQEGSWTFDGTGEVTCNLFSLYALEKVMGVKGGQQVMVEGLSSEGRKKMWNEYLQTNKSFEKWKSEPFLALMMYMQLMEKYGWESYEKVFQAYHKLPEDQLPKNDDEKRDTWLKMYSKTVGENLSDFFDAWNVPVSQGAKNSLKNLPKANTQELMKN